MNRNKQNLNSDEVFTQYVQNSQRWKDLFEKIGYCYWSTINKKACMKRMQRLDLHDDLSRLSNRRKILKPYNKLKKKRRQTSSLWSILKNAGRLEICEFCRCEKMTLEEGKWIWNGKPLTLQIDHILGLTGDDPDRLDNLRILCPLCHMSTDNWGKQKKRKQNKKTYRKGGWPKKPHINALKRIGREYVCAHCKCVDFEKDECWQWLWNGLPVKFEVNHIKGRNIENANDPTNLEYVCTNCHSQTENWCGKGNRKTRDVS